MARFESLRFAPAETRRILRERFASKLRVARQPRFVGLEPIPHDDSRPAGFVGRYTGDFGEVKVAFLVLNMGQQRQLGAAKTADATKKRRAPRKPRLPSRVSPTS